MVLTKQLSPSADDKTAEVPIKAIVDAVKSIRFGAVQLVIQDGKIVQIDKTEKIRLA